MTIIGMLGGTTLAVVGWLQAVKMRGSQPHVNEIAMYIHSSIYTLLAVLSLFGFIGAIIKNRTMVSIFFMMLVGHFTFSIFSGAFALHNVFRSSTEDAMQQCVPELTDPQGITVRDCFHNADIVKAIAIAIFIMVWLFEIWGCLIANSYVRQLDDEQESTRRWPKLATDLEVGQISGPRPL